MRAMKKLSKPIPIDALISDSDFDMKAYIDQKLTEALIIEINRIEEEAETAIIEGHGSTGGTLTSSLIDRTEPGRFNG